MATGKYWGRLAVVGASSLCACSNLSSLPEEWVKTVREYNYIAVWPARQDFQVGDVYAICNNPVDGTVNNALTKDALPIMLARLDVRTKLRENYSKSVTLPQRLVEPASGIHAVKAASAPAADSMPVAPVAAPSASAALPADVRQMAVALPDLGSVRVSGSQLGATLPGGAFLASLGINAQSLKSVAMSVPTAISYGLPHSELRALADSGSAGSRDNLTAAHQLAFGCQSKSASLVVISEVIAAYAIRVDMEFSGGTQAGAKAALLLPPESRRVLVTKTLGKLFGVNLPTEGSNDGSTAAALTVPAASTPAASAPVAQGPVLVQNGKPLSESTTELVSALRKAFTIDNQVAPDYPGATASVSYASDSQLALDTHFTEPVTFAYRYMLLSTQTLSAAERKMLADGGPEIPREPSEAVSASSGMSVPGIPAPAAIPPTNR